MKIVTDSAADLPEREIVEHNIVVAPLHIRFPEGEITSDAITPDDFYNRLRAMEPDIPTTSQPSAGVFQKIYQKVAETKEEILSIHISSGLSGTIESARLGAQQTPEANISVVDTLTLSGGERFQVLAAAAMIRAGVAKEAILEHLAKIQQNTLTIYTLETLTYLARGGRIGRVQALAGALLKLKPIISVDNKDGKYNSTGKARTMPRALEMIAENLQERFGNNQVWVTVLHGQFQAQADALAVLLKSRLNVGKLETLRISPVLGVHTGPGIVGAAVTPMNLMEGVG